LENQTGARGIYNVAYFFNTNGHFESDSYASRNFAEPLPIGFYSKRIDVHPALTARPLRKAWRIFWQGTAVVRGGAAGLEASTGQVGCEHSAPRG